MSTNEMKAAEFIRIDHLADIPELCPLTEAQLGKTFFAIIENFHHL